MRVFHITPERYTELDALPHTLPASGYLWVGTDRPEFEAQLAELQSGLQRWTGGQIVDLHVADLLNQHLPSNFDYTSWYDLLVFRRLAAGVGSSARLADDAVPEAAGARAALEAIDTSPVGFALFDRVLVTVHPSDCVVRDFFANRLQMQAQGGDARATARIPPNAADMMLRMINFMVDSYLDLRRLLTRQLAQLQQQLFSTRAHYGQWQTLLDARNTLHALEDTCEDQRSAIVEWLDALEESPAPGGAAALRERELLRVRSRDLLEHIERVLSHVRRLESAAETAVQMHFAAQSNRTNDIMRTLTVLTAIFLPLNLLTGFFGMNFDDLPLIHSVSGFWVVLLLMLVLGVGLSVLSWRKRYFGRSR